MSWLLFLDETGHDHKTMPYEVRGGFAIHASKLWPFIRALRISEQSIFGTSLRDYDLEIKGSKLLRSRCFLWAAQAENMDDATRRKHALNFLNCGKQGRQPRGDEFTAYGQACIAMAEQVILLLLSHDARIFASVIPRIGKPVGTPPEYLRKDHVFLFERYFYFLEQKQEPGLIVMDATDKHDDRRFVRRMERYFTQTMMGRQRTAWIVPSPFFVESDMAYGVQAADLCIYCLNWGWRTIGMGEPTRNEIEPFCRLLEKCFWQGDGYRDGKTFRTRGVVFVPDPYQTRITGREMGPPR
ncbi:MAG: DUF3800 domain-containing protein [Phycisphaerales bacterium]|nr:DUF3800 domain-containing protein [Phycisphaerales bacterium]